jgi:hypothetical protein
MIVQKPIQEKDNGSQVNTLELVKCDQVNTIEVAT